MSQLSALQGPGLSAAKGHGTGNDFVLIADPAGTLDVTADQVRRVCDRKFGIGADGLIRATPATTELLEQHGVLAGPPGRQIDDAAGDVWFMDYRNHDGSLAQMCGNGVRVFAQYLLATGLVSHDQVAAGLQVLTRSGVKVVRPLSAPGAVVGQFCVDMGPWRLSGGPAAHDRAGDCVVGLHGLDGVLRPGCSVDVGNPHTVVALASLEELAAVDLSRRPTVEAPGVADSNVEVVVINVGDHGAAEAEIAMRVFERGVGETLSCGTGACAAAIAAAAWAGPEAPTRWQVDVPGGRLQVDVLPDRVLLSGPAVIVADVAIAANVLG